MTAFPDFDFATMFKDDDEDEQDGNALIMDHHHPGGRSMGQESANEPITTPPPPADDDPPVALVVENSSPKKRQAKRNLSNGQNDQHQSASASVSWGNSNESNPTMSSSAPMNDHDRYVKEETISSTGGSTFAPPTIYRGLIGGITTSTGNRQQQPSKHQQQIIILNLPPPPPTMEAVLRSRQKHESMKNANEKSSSTTRSSTRSAPSLQAASAHAVVANPDSLPIIRLSGSTSDGVTFEDGAKGRCDTCGISFSTKRHRAEHFRDVHGVEKPWKCKQCDARFPYSSSLHNHIRIHSESRPFKCTMCDASFRWKNSLRHHRLYIHKEKPENVAIDSKCVLEGKFPAGKFLNTSFGPRATANDVQSSMQSTTGDSSASQLPPRPRPQKRVSLVDHQPPKTRHPFEIDIDKVMEEADRQYAVMVSEQISAADETTTYGNEAKRRRKSTRPVAARAIGAGGGGSGAHTCGHCEKEFQVWSDLVAHIKVCAEQERSHLADDSNNMEDGEASGAAGTSGWMTTDDGDNEDGANGGAGWEEEEESDADSDAPAGLVIDQFGTGGIRQDNDEDEEEEEFLGDDAAIIEAIGRENLEQEEAIDGGEDDHEQQTGDGDHEDGSDEARSGFERADQENFDDDDGEFEDGIQDEEEFDEDDDQSSSQQRSGDPSKPRGGSLESTVDRLKSQLKKN